MAQILMFFGTSNFAKCVHEGGFFYLLLVMKVMGLCEQSGTREARTDEPSAL